MLGGLIVTNRKKILELLEVDTCPNAICNFCEHFRSTSACERYKRERLADHLIANGVTFMTDNNVGSNWISVADKFPEIVSTHKHRRYISKKSTRVLCVCKQKSGKRMAKEGYCEWFDDHSEPRWRVPGEIDSVTHWMPLPEVPEEVSNV